ncbi:hypothetical protein [Sphingomonas mollis]|uniref:MarR family transcriptional regulator n=1 Tax=Sphingomonas mollis TaxID=2795726 RepID=A0ABS0XUN3_9SPHN|nr:hypothetical protein [Sphingomonas sp. BT553]MBJ6123751.1 hypothetical protein [Sphingomonas sp. BT553]
MTAVSAIVLAVFSNIAHYAGYLAVGGTRHRTLSGSQGARAGRCGSFCQDTGWQVRTASIEHLEALGYISRETDITDRRRANVMMLPALAAAAEQWFDLQLAALCLGC